MGAPGGGGGPPEPAAWSDAVALVMLAATDGDGEEAFMTTRAIRRTALAGATATIAALSVATAAQAATVTVTGDDGNQAPLTAGVTGQIRVMQPQVTVTPATPRVSVTAVGPDGQAAFTQVTCYSIPVNRQVDYRGNGDYTLTVTEYSDTSCRTVAAATTYTFAIAAGVSLPPPGGPVLTRKLGTYTTNRIQLPIAANPGASSIEVVYKRNAAVQPDGSLPGEVRTAFWNRDTGTAELSFPVPGAYTVVARASSGLAKSPWSAPITLRTFSPFDVSSVIFLDSRGPSYQIRGRLYDSFARGGKVQIQVARGKRGGKFRSLGSATVTRKGTFVKRFTLTQPGAYRMRYVFKGNALVAGGRSTQNVTITRRYVYR